MGGITVNTTQELDDLRHGKFHVDCPRMILKPASGEGRQFAGGGFIELGDGGRLLGRLVSPDPYPIDELARSLNLQAGTLIGDEELYHLECQDLSGRFWRSRDVMIGVNGGPHGFTVGFHPQQIRAEGPSIITKSRRTVLLYFDTNAQFPTNAKTKVEEQRADRPVTRSWSADTARVEWDDLTMYVTRDSEGLEVEIIGDRADDEVAHCVIHALEFVLNAPMTPLCVIIHAGDVEETRVFDRVHCDTRGPFGPHIGVRSRKYADDYWSACTLYERFLRQHMGEERAPLHGFVSAVHHARQSRDFETMCLTLGVKLESLVRTWLPHVVDHEVTTDDKNKLRDAIQNAGATLPVRDRALGLVANVLDAFPARRALRKLAAEGVIVKDAVAAWDALRRPTAHGDSIDLSQASLEACGKLWSAFQRTVLHLIGYAGHITDYGALGYPTVDFGRRADDADVEGSAELH